MATILKVHGTFASGPEEGDKWWQRGSECCGHVGELVEAEDGNLKIEPVVWDGLNSERSRQSAAAKLLDRMSALEKAGEPYCVVGHSHGGSVISAALLRAAFYKRPLEKLSRWITIGTPFIEAKRSRLLFARLGPAGKTVFLTIWAFFIAAMVFGTRDAATVSESKTGLGLWLIILATMIILLIAICYPFLWLLARNSLHWHDRRAQERARHAYASRWLSLRHEDDEAVQGLGAFRTIRHPIFPRNFAVAALSRLSILVVPLLVAGAMFALPSPQADKEQQQQVVDDRLKAQPAAQTPKAQQVPAASAAPTAPSASAPSTSPGEEKRDPLWAIALIISLLVAVIVGIPVGVYLLVHWASRPASAALSYGLNRMTWSQLRQSSLGSDIDGESGIHAREHPVWIETATRPLPQALAAELTQVSDAAAAGSIQRLRAALSELGVFRLEQDGRDALNAFLTGDELIHTTYFKIPRFRKLLAYSIAVSPGFRPTAAFRSDPDFPLIEQWYRELTAAPAATPSSSTPSPPA
jgi:hypothetical protein